jgi:PhnB protein
MSTLTPYLCCADAAGAIAFYQVAFGAVEVERWTADDGRIGHARLDVHGSPVYLADEHPEIGVVSPNMLGGTPISLVLEVPDDDAAV